MVKSFEEVKQRLLACPVKRKIGVAAAHDEHTLDAVVMAARDGLVDPVLVGDEEKICRLLKELDFDPAGAGLSMCQIRWRQLRRWPTWYGQVNWTAL